MESKNITIENLLSEDNSKKGNLQPGLIYSADFGDSKAFGCIFGDSNSGIYNLMFLYSDPVGGEKDAREIQKGDLSLLELLIDEKERMSLYSPINNNNEKVGSFSVNANKNQTVSNNLLINYIQNIININYKGENATNSQAKFNPTTEKKKQIVDLYRTHSKGSNSVYNKLQTKKLKDYSEEKDKINFLQNYQNTLKNKERAQAKSTASEKYKSALEFNLYDRKNNKRQLKPNYVPQKKLASKAIENYQKPAKSAYQRKTQRLQPSSYTKTPELHAKSAFEKRPINYSKNNLENRLSTSYDVKNKPYNALPQAEKTKEAYGRNPVALEPYKNQETTKKIPVLEKKSINYNNDNRIRQKLAPGYGVKKPSYNALPQAGAKNAYALPQAEYKNTIPLNIKNNQYKEKVPVNSIDELAKANSIYKGNSEKPPQKSAYKPASAYDKAKQTSNTYSTKKPSQYKTSSPYKASNLEGRLEKNYNNNVASKPKGLLQDRGKPDKYTPRTSVRANYKKEGEKKPSQYKAMESGGMKPGRNYLKNLAKNPNLSPLPDYTKNPSYFPASDNGYMKSNAPYKAMPSSSPMKALPPGRTGYQKALPASYSGNVLNMSKPGYSASPAYSAGGKK